MDSREYTESGTLELYVYGLLNQAENEEIAKVAREYPEVEKEIIAIEKAVMELSAGFAPALPMVSYEKIKSQIDLKKSAQVPAVYKPRRNWAAFLGWAAALLFLLGAGFLFKLYRDEDQQNAEIREESRRAQKRLLELETNYNEVESAATLMRDRNNIITTLTGGQLAPESIAKIYWNRETLSVYLDALTLPDPPEGMVYQVWAIKLKPMRPLSIGILTHFTMDQTKLFPLSTTSEADAFGITLEPTGGSESPTMEQLYVFGKI